MTKSSVENRNRRSRVSEKGFFFLTLYSRSERVRGQELGRRRRRRRRRRRGRGQRGDGGVVRPTLRLPHVAAEALPGRAPGAQRAAGADAVADSGDARDALPGGVAAAADAADAAATTTATTAAAATSEAHPQKAQRQPIVSFPLTTELYRVVPGFTGVWHTSCRLCERTVRHRLLTLVFFSLKIVG